MRAACGWELSQSGADNLTIAAVCAVGRGLEAPALLVIVPVHFFLRRQLAFFPHTSLLRTQQTSIKTKAVVTAQMLALKLTSLPWIMAPASSRYCKCKLGAPVRPLCQIAVNTRVTKRRVLCGPSLSNCSKYSMLSVKVTMRRDGMSPGFSPGNSFTDHSMDGREQVAFLSFWPP